MNESATVAYAQDAPSPDLVQLRGVHSTRVCVVGAGLAGLNTALGLCERGVQDVTVLEAEQPGFGASGRNGGFVFAGFSRSEARLLADLGPQRARTLYRGTQDGIDLIRARIARYRIECEAVEGGALWVNWFRDAQVLRRRQALLSEHFDTQWHWWPRERVRAEVCSERYHDALFEPNALHLNPLRYVHGLVAALGAHGACVYGQSRAIALRPYAGGWQIDTPAGRIDAEHVVLACGGYLAGLRRQVDAAVLPIATYVMQTEPLGARTESVLRTKAAVYDTRFAFDYYRMRPDTRLLWGGRITIRERSPDAVRRLLYRDLLRVFPQLAGVRIEAAWSGWMSYARHEMPHIGQIDRGLWLAQAFGGHGLAPTTYAGELLAAAIASGDRGWRAFAPYPLRSAFKPVGLLAAQLHYSLLQAADAVRARLGR